MIERVVGVRASSTMAVAALVGSVMLTGGAQAGEPGLRQIMRDLNADLGDVTQGLMREDWAAMARAADAIADHPPIPQGQVRAIRERLGKEMKGFVQIDRRVHDAAVRIRGAAQREDAQAVLRHTRSLMQGCVACHGTYRDRLQGISGGAR